MKKHLTTIVGVSVALLLGNLTSGWAVSTPKVEPDPSVQQSLRSATPLTLPATAAKLVVLAKKSLRTVTAVASVRYALDKHPAVAMQVLQAVAAVAPDNAAEIAAALIKVAPDRFSEIVTATAAGAPKSARKIVAVLCQQEPLKFAETVVLVAKQVPDASPQLLDALAESLPGTKLAVNRVRSGNVGQHGFTITVSTVNVTLAQVNQLAQIVANTLGGTGSFQAAAAAILRGDIVVDAAGKITSIDTAAINAYTDVPADFKSNLNTQQATVTSAVATQADNPGSSYATTVANGGVAPTPIPVGQTVEVTDTKVRPYSN